MPPPTPTTGLLSTALNLLAIGTSTPYLLPRLTHNLGEQEARLDKIEGTLRGHIGLIEDSLKGRRMRISRRTYMGRRDLMRGTKYLNSTECKVGSLPRDVLGNSSHRG
ncbi:hypothetical protein CC80DRAFT_491202 [Byssothecium circinans]|uniref:Uncharacterized protein n=1 Tax=Byssothecium circinans TaxID=147558 RepID=A0A6A5TZT7_9PLEO|nr:hypothetical protein CC80DRAFT_491202 [Byssothecium circinans]